MSMLTTFECSGCGKSYTLKPELAGRKVKCKCGSSMIAPELPVEDELYDLVDDLPKAAPAPKAVAAPVSAKSKSANVAAPVAQPMVAQPMIAQPVAPAAGTKSPIKKRHIEYRRGLSQKERDRNASPIEMGRDVIAPLILLVLGLGGLIGVVVYTLDGGSVGSFAFAVLFVGVYAFIKTIVMIGSAFFAAPVAGVSFGPTFWTVMLKLAAVALAPEAVYSIINLFTGGIFGLSISLAVIGVCYLIMFCQLFSLELDDSWLVTRIMIAIRVAVELAFVGILIALGT